MWGRSTTWAGQVREDFSEEGVCEVQKTRRSEPGTRPGKSTPSRGQRCWSGKGMESDFMFKKYCSGCCVSVYDKKPGWKQVHVITTISPHTRGLPDSERSIEELWPRDAGMPGGVSSLGNPDPHLHLRCAIPQGHC